MVSLQPPLEVLDQKLLIMAMLQGLPSQYKEWAESLMIQDMAINTVQEAFKMRDLNDQKRAETQDTSSNVSEAALAASTSTPAPFQPPATSTPAPMCCDFCNKTGHTQDRCWAYSAAKKELQASKGKKKAETASNVSEFAGNSAVRRFPASHPSYNIQLTPCIIADAGASSTMTPHRFWFISYEKDSSRWVQNMSANSRKRFMGLNKLQDNGISSYTLHATTDK